MTTEELLAQMEQDRLQRIAEDESLAIIVKTALATKSTIIPLLTFFSANKERIGVVLLNTPKFTLYRYMTCGPTGHLSFTPEKIGGELRAEGFEPVADPLAGETLELWAKQPEWEKGLKQSQFIGLWNTFSWYGRHDLCRQIDRAADLDSAIQLGAQLLQKELPGKKWC